ncbi:hypothetical protein PRUPE_1G383200 [Prunus persica]|uniref:NAC domain-containing protein n=1 Tax=Prunus persica TaxID=3760 RepID=A0A251R9S8_PRUPE|nr:hypothetical protein PRUPE_1G383200 [Prunus persica]
MCPQSATLPADIGFQCTDEELCISLGKIISGSPLPGNVIEDANPYQLVPSNLPDGFWYFIHSNENKPTNFGYWRTKGEACRIFSNSSITGWRATLEFYQGQAPNESKTDWVMQEYWLTQKKLSEDSKAKVSKDNERGTLIVTERVPDHDVQIMPEIDYVSRGDYLELLDLDTPASFSFSSDSSCLTMSSDECFDSLALLEELEPKNSQDLVNKNAGCKFSISAPPRPDELVIFAASSGSFSKSPSEERVKTHSPIPGSAVCGKISGKTSNNMNRIQKPDCRNEGGPSTSHNVDVSPSSHTASQEGKRRARTIGRTEKLKKKYFCFMPF